MYNELELFVRRKRPKAEDRRREQASVFGLRSSIFLIFAFSSILGAQNLKHNHDPLPDVQRHFIKYPFLEKEENIIVNNDALEVFYQKIAKLERGEIDKVSIVHIGDSHIQADFWSGWLRRLFQYRFGSAGRGFVFPFGLAESHNPLDIKTTSNTNWQYHRNIYKKGPAMGISGASIATDKADFYIELTIKDSLVSDKFDKITLFNNKGKSAFDFTLGKGDVKKADLKKIPVKRKYHRVRSGETLSHLARKYHTSVRNLKYWNRLRTSRINIGQRLKVSKPQYAKPKTPDFKRFAYLANTEYPDSVFMATLLLDEPVNQLVIKAEKILDAQKETIIYGLVFENTTEQGVLYNAIGVNGATFNHYNKATHFFEQLKRLEADLVIVSLGTNESLGSKLDNKVFSNQSALFFENLKEALPMSAVLVTTNPAVLKKKKYKNEGNEVVRKVLISQAMRGGFAYWDLQKIMGEKGAMENWQKTKLARKDGVHFTRKGYKIQAELLFDAIMKGYNAGN